MFHIRGAAKKKKKENGPKAGIRCRIPKAEGNTVEPLLLYRKMELPAAGEHVFAVESIEKKRSRKVCHKSTEGHFYTHAQGKEDLFGFPSPPYGLHVVVFFHLIICKMTVQCRVRFAA